MSLFSHMSVDSMFHLGLGIVLVAGIVAAMCCCAIILKRQLYAAWKNSSYSFFGAKEFEVPYWVLVYCLIACPVLTIYMNALFVYEETLKQAGLL